MIYEVTQPGWLEPGWYIAGQEWRGPYESRLDAEAALLLLTHPLG